MNAPMSAHVTATNASLEDKLFFTRLPFFQKLGVMADIGSGPGAPVSKEIELRRLLGPKQNLDIIAVDPAHGGDWGHFLKTAAAEIAEPDDHYAVYANRGLLFSSVLHEMFSSGGHYKGFNPLEFWMDCTSIEADYVIVRDMCYVGPTDASALELDRLYSALEYFLRLAPLYAMVGLDEQHRQTIARIMGPHRQKTEAVRLAFEQDPQTIHRVAREAIQLKLKAKDKSTFEREIREDYFSIDPLAFVVMAEEQGYEVIHSKFYSMDPATVDAALPPQLKGKVTTHAQWVFHKPRDKR